METFTSTNQLSKGNLDPARHPCFNEKTRCETARVHLPVASRCNMQCNFCDRRYSCVNESRPGVTSTMLTPRQALEYVHRQVERMPNLAVVGIAGPGDPFANPDETLQTLSLVREHYPDMLLCVASNGLALPAHVPALAEIGVSHVTVTVNAVDPTIGSVIYGWMRYGKRTHTGIEAATYLWEQQAWSIRAMADAGILVKVNSIYIPTINEGHIETIAKTVASIGASIHNVMALKPTPNTVFAGFPEPSPTEVGRARLKAKQFLPQMSHCSRCRADAAGLIGHEQTSEDRQVLRDVVEMDLGTTQDQARTPGPIGQKKSKAPGFRGRVAVATMEGLLVNQHLGEADSLDIYAIEEGVWTKVATRPTPSPGSGAKRWEDLADLIGDCGVLLVSGVGPGPRKVLETKGLRVEEVEGLLAGILDVLSSGGDFDRVRKQAAFQCGSSCSGTGGGCG